MTDITCPAPECEAKWPSSLAPEVLLRLLDMHERAVHPSPATTTTPMTTVVKTERGERPVISASRTREEWAYFSQQWLEYKEATCLTGQDIIFQLLQCCDEPLREDLSRSCKNITSCDETTLLSHIKSLAVRQENVMVSRLQLHQMQQGIDEPVQVFFARVKGQASACQYHITCKCGTHLSYCDHMIKETLIVGLADDDIRLDVLDRTNQDMSLHETVFFIEARESGKCLPRHIKLDPTDVPVAIDAARSSGWQTESRQHQSRPLDKNTNTNTHTETQPCSSSGRKGHSSKRKVQMKHSPVVHPELSNVPKSPNREHSSVPKSPNREQSSVPKSPNREHSSVPKSPNREQSSVSKSPTRVVKSSIKETTYMHRSLKALQPYNKLGLRETPLPEKRSRKK